MMSRESQLVLSNFIDKNQFNLNSYLTCLFHQFYTNLPNQPKK